MFTTVMVGRLSKILSFMCICMSCFIGTVEKLGVSVNAVMDRLLAEVCQDGITRHSAIVNKREKKRR